MIGTSKGRSLDIEESAVFGNVNSMYEGLYTDSVVCSDANKMALEIEDDVKKGSTMKDALLRAIRRNDKTIAKGALKRGKNKAATGDITSENVLESKRKRNRVEKFVRIGGKHSSEKKRKTKTVRFEGDSVGTENEMLENLVKATDKYEAALAMQPEAAVRTPSLKRGEQSSSSSESGERNPDEIKQKGKPNRKWKGRKVANVGDLISVRPEIFDDDTESYSKANPGLVFGTVNSITPNGIANVTWVEDLSSNNCKLRDLTVVRSKRNVKSVLAGIIALLVKGKPIKKKKNDDFPKDFFEVLVREDWRKWVEAVKKELEAWDDNNAVEEVDITSVPVTAKIVP
jgi:hypothetical protein